MKTLSRVVSFVLSLAVWLMWLLVMVEACTTSSPTEPSVVILRDGMPECSGIAIAPQTLLTAAHCVLGLDPGDSIAFVTRDKWRGTARGFDVAKIVSVDADRDLATLSSLITFLNAPEQRRPGLETVWARSALFEQVHTGRVLPGFGFFRDTTLTIAPGWSGSPVFGADGKLVGIVHSCLGGFENGQKFCLPESGTFAVLPAGAP